MSEQPATTEMVRFECRVCTTGATCVATPAATLAWLDHMSIHADREAYDAWSWAVVPFRWEP